MLSVLWRLTKGHRLTPWKSPYLRWRLETYTGVHAETITFAQFFSLSLAQPEGVPAVSEMGGTHVRLVDGRAFGVVDDNNLDRTLRGFELQAKLLAKSLHN